MRRCIALTLLVAGIFVAASPAVAQEGWPIVWEQQWHVLPGQEGQFEEARKEVLEYLAETGYPFNQNVSRSQNNVYRIFSIIDSWEDFGAIDEWRASLSGRQPPAALQAWAETATRIDRAVWRLRPDLGYSPTQNRLQPGEFGFVQEVRFTLRPGPAGRAAAAVRELSALYDRHDNARGRAVWTSEANRGQVLSTFHFARDAADHASESAREQQVMGDELPALREDLNAAAVKREFVQWTMRRDLAFQRPD